MKKLELMKTLAASEAKNRFEKLLDWARREPIAIEKQGRQIAVMLSIEEYERLSALDSQLEPVHEESNDEDQFWALRAEKAKKEGFIGQEESEALLEDLLNA